MHQQCIIIDRPLPDGIKRAIENFQTKQQKKKTSTTVTDSRQESNKRRLRSDVFVLLRYKFKQTNEKRRRVEFKSSFGRIYSELQSLILMTAPQFVSHRGNIQHRITRVSVFAVHQHQCAPFDKSQMHTIFATTLNYTQKSQSAFAGLVSFIYLFSLFLLFKCILMIFCIWRNSNRNEEHIIHTQYHWTVRNARELCVVAVFMLCFYLV